MVEAMRIDGADISHHQGGSLSLSAFKKAGGKFLYHKSTEGSTWVDDKYSQRRAEAQKAGIPFGAYHFARPEGNDAVAEARHFMKVADPRPGDLCPALDLEVTGGLNIAQLTSWTGQFLQEVARLAGVECVLYTPYELNRYYRSMLWRPRYNNNNTPPVQDDWDIWQFSNGQAGVPNQAAGLGHVDLNTLRPGVKVGDFTIPVEEEEPDEPLHTNWLRFMTQNVQALPLMPQPDVVEDVKLTAKEAGIICWQEIGPDRYEKAVEGLGTRWSHYFGTVGDIDNPISWRDRQWNLVKSGQVKLHDGKAKLSKTKWLSWVKLEHKKTGARIIVHNWHYINGAFNNEVNPQEALRLPTWKQDNAVHRELVRGWIDQGLPIIGGGDANRRHGHDLGPLLGKTLAGKKVRYPVSDRSIDVIVVINGENWSWEVDDKNGETMPGRNSDHRGRRARVRLVKK